MAKPAVIKSDNLNTFLSLFIWHVSIYINKECLHQHEFLSSLLVTLMCQIASYMHLVSLLPEERNYQDEIRKLWEMKKNQDETIQELEEQLCKTKRGKGILFCSNYMYSFMLAHNIPFLYVESQDVANICQFRKV